MTLSNQAQSERRIAAAQAARVPADSQGRPTREPTTYTYDESGQLVSATPADPSPPDEAA